MDFLKKIRSFVSNELFKKNNKKPIESRIISIKIDHVADWTEKESEKIFIKVRPSIKQKYKEIEELLKEIEENKIILNDAEFNKQLLNRPKKAAISNKSNFIKNLDFVLNKIKIPDDDNPIQAYEFYKNSMSILSASIEHSIRSQQYVKAFYPKEYDAVVVNLSELNKVLEELYDIIKENKTVIEIREKIKIYIDKILENQKFRSEKKMNLLNYEGKILKMKKELEVKKNNLSNLKSSKEFELQIQNERRIQSIENELKKIDFDIKQLFAPLSKVLIRIKKQDEIGKYTLSDEKRKVLNILIETPELIPTTDINPLLQEIKSEIGKHTFGLKQPKLNKTIEHINKLIAMDMVEIIENRNKLFKNHSILSNELNELTIYKDIAEIEKSISELKSSIESIENNIALENEQLLSLKQDGDKLLDEIQNRLSNIFNKNIKIYE